MAASFSEIAPDLAEWMQEQPLFFVATAPKDGHVNVSPKGYDTFRVLGPRRAAYLDLTGSGIETIAHLRENGRITVMFCAFAGNPRIARIHGSGRVHELGTDGYDALAPAFADLPGARAIIEIDADRISTSCGYAVPLMDLVEDRDRLEQWAVAKGHDGLVAYRETKNATSIDGRPGYGAR
jgi:Pyridoxamine 5'-phosphate oxidase